MKYISVRLILLFLSLFAASTAHAAMDPAIVSADARWVVYADFNALRGSVLGRELISGVEKSEMESHQGGVTVNLQKLFAIVGAATAYGTHLSLEANEVDGVLIFQGSPDLHKIAEALVLEINVAHPEHAVELTDLPFPAYALRPGAQENGKKMEVIIAFPPEPIVLLSRSREQLLKAREVFRGKAPSLARQASSPLAKFLPGSADAYLFAASIVPSDEMFKQDGPKARIFKMADSASLAVGEHGPNTAAHVALTANSSQMADKLMKILQGMTAMMSLAETDDKQLADFLNSAAVSRDENTVTLDLSYASDHLVQMLHRLRERSKPEAHASEGGKLVRGQVVAEWHAVEAPHEGGADSADADPAPVALSSRTIDNVALKNGSLISLGRRGNGGANIHFKRIEISRVDGTGAPLVFRADFMKLNGAGMAQMEFPGADGAYTLKVAYENDPAGKATYAVGVSEPKPEPAPASAPVKPAAKK